MYYRVPRWASALLGPRHMLRTGTTQAGYPLRSPSMAGGYSGGCGKESIPILSAPFHRPGGKRRLAAEGERAANVS